MKLIVTGGRAYGERVYRGEHRPSHAKERAHVYAVLDRVHAKRPITRLVQGGCTGADRMAREWGAARGVQVVTYHYVDELGPRGGPERNGNMVADGADGAVAFCGGRGTSGCVELLEKAGVKVLDERAKGPGGPGRG